MTSLPMPSDTTHKRRPNVKPLLVMKKDGTSYIECDHWKRKVTLINGAMAVPCPGNEHWAMVDGDVTSIFVEREPIRQLTGFRLKEEFAGVVTTLESELPLEAFTRDEDGVWCGEHVELYETAWVDHPQEPESQECEVIDFDCEPVDMPSYVVVDFPSNLKFHRAIQHKYPCHISMPAVFQLVAEAVVAETAKHPGLYRLHDCRNIGILGVDAVLKITPRKVRRDVGFRRPKWKTVTETQITKRVLGIVGEYRDKSGYEQIGEIQAKEYSELKVTLERYIQSFVDRIDPQRWCVCPTCNGEAVVLADND